METEKKSVHIQPRNRMSKDAYEKEHRKISKKQRKNAAEKGRGGHKEKEQRITQHEDIAVKITAAYLGEEVLDFFHVEGKVKELAATESIYLEVKKMYEDFNVIMEDGSWKHFEFQSSDKGIKDLKRFRSYEAVISQQHNVSVTTYVLYSGNIKNPKVEFTEGINTYRVVPLIMQEYDAERYFQELLDKIKSKRKIEKRDLVPLALSPLMGGSITQKERIEKAFSILKEATELEAVLVQKIEAVIYTMANKFLNKKELREIEEEMKMTRLGQMLWDDGMQQGMQQGIRQGVEALVSSCRCLNASREQVAEMLRKNLKLSKEKAEEYLKEYW